MPGSPMKDVGDDGQGGFMIATNSVPKGTDSAGKMKCKFLRMSGVFYLTMTGNPSPQRFPKKRRVRSMFHFWGKGFLFLLLISGENFWATPSAFSWEVSTHMDLTREALEQVAIGEGQDTLDLNTYLIKNLGLQDGLEEILMGDSGNAISAREWIIQGSKFEDNGRRPLNHFHDAISNRGLVGIPGFGGISAISWVLEGVGEQDPGGPWSWNDAREHYFKALTSTTKTEREDHLVKVFRALGQVMHLLQDLANPAHVRNDAHPDFSEFIGSLGRVDPDGLHDYMARKRVSDYLGDSVPIPDPLLVKSIGATRPEPLSNLFDHDVYTGINPGTTLGLNVGIAEYTNANFFSDDTIPFQSLPNPWPSFPSLTELVQASGPNRSYVTLLRLGSPADPSARVAKYTGNQALAKFSLANLPIELIGQLQLDDAVYDAYVTHLIPRAVGYSAAVLQYFFRGEVEIERAEYTIRGQNIGGPFCNETPADESGGLSADYTIPPDLNFDGTVSLYYDRNDADETRVELSRFEPESVFHEEIENPVPMYLVLEGQLGPGAQELRGVVVKRVLADWRFFCVH